MAKRREQSTTAELPEKPFYNGRWPRKSFTIYKFKLGSTFYECYIYTEYSKMPPVFYMDLYNDCLLKPNGTYCMTYFSLVSDTHSDLLDVITEYSNFKITHFNHTKLRHGLCVSQRCKQFNPESNKEDQKLALEECLNETYWENYKLKTKLLETFKCLKNTEEPVNIDTSDIIALVVFAVFLIMNLLGTLYDLCLTHKHGNGNTFLMSFSVRKNFSKLVMFYENVGVNEKRLKSLHGLRVLTMVCVIALHAMMIVVISPEDTLFVEKFYDKIVNYLFLNGTLVVQTFFIMAGFLLAYKVEDLSTKSKITWQMIPKGILNTLVRLTPSYAIVILFTVTWFRYLGSGPFWETIVISEAESCRANWWKHLLYINNYFDDSYCMLQTWYLAANVQLMILGYFVCLLARERLTKKWTLSILFIIGIVLPAAHTFFQNLDATLLMTPEFAFTFNEYPTFNHVYKRGHTNIPDFIMGIALGYYTYYCQNSQVDIRKYKKYRFLYKLTLPVAVMTMLLGLLFKDTYNISPYIKALYAGLIKPVFGCCVCLIIFSSIFKMESLYRPILEWRMWQVPSKLSYTAYIIHMVIVRLMTGMQTSVNSVNYWHLFQIALGVNIIVYALTVPVWLCIEGPLNELYDMATGKNKSTKASEKKEKYGVVNDNLAEDDV